MWTDEETDSQQTKLKDTWIVMRTDGQTPFKRIGSFRDYAKAPKSNFSLHWHQNLHGCTQYHDGHKQACSLANRHPCFFSSPRWEEHRCLTVPYITTWSRDEAQ